MEGLDDRAIRREPDALLRCWARRERGFAWSINTHRFPLISSSDRGSYLILSAPHAGSQTRDGRTKVEDSGTGSLIEIVGQAWALSTVTVSGTQPDDPNWDHAVGPYKRELHSILQREPHLVLDVHAMRPDNRPDICLGLGNYPSAHTLALALELQRLALDRGFVVTIDNPFNARRSSTITSYVQSLHRDAMQIEINAKWMRPGSDPQAAERFLSWFSEAIEISASETYRRRAA